MYLLFFIWVFNTDFSFSVGIGHIIKSDSEGTIVQHLYTQLHINPSFLRMKIFCLLRIWIWHWIAFSKFKIFSSTCTCKKL